MDEESGGVCILFHLIADKLWHNGEIKALKDRTEKYWHEENEYEKRVF